jgi:outer membrane protein assembly factor BamA
MIVALLCPVAGEAQRSAPRAKPAPAKTAWPVETIGIEGNHDFSREQILTVLGIKVGAPVTPNDIDAARQRLLDSGAFQSVGWKYVPAADGKGYALSFQVIEAAPLFPVRFEDLPVSPAEMEAALRLADPMFGAKIPATEPVLYRYRNALQAFLATKNYKDEISAKLLPDDAGQMGVVFRPAAGLPVVARVRFANNQAVPSSALENAINPVAIGFPYKETRFRLLLDSSIRPLYEARGRVKVAFPEIRTEPEIDVKGLVVTVKVDEGGSYSVGQVQVASAVVTSAELLKIAGLKTGEVFNIDRVRTATAGIEKRVRREGFMHVTTRVERVVNDQAKTVDLKIHVESGPRYLFGKLDIQGLDLITEPAIRKMWSIQPGQPFNADYPDSFLTQIRQDGILDNLGETKAQVKPDDAAHTVDVTLLFRGAPPPPEHKNRNW